jgi:NCAIR mutase (PurE)-related protein
MAALFAMLNSCRSIISLVSIDSGLGAAYLAHLVNA